MTDKYSAAYLAGDELDSSAALVDADYLIKYDATTGNAETCTMAQMATYFEAGELDPLTITSSDDHAIAVGPNGETNPVFRVDASTSSAATGVLITGAAAASGVAVAAVSSGTNENLTIDAKGSGTITLNGTATGAVTITPATTITGLATLTAGIDAKVIFAGTETIAAGGTSTALALTKTVHYIDADAGGDTFTLADGVEGQIMSIAMASATGTATITPANLRGGTSVTFNAAGDSVMLQFIASSWNIMGGNSYGVA